LYPTLPLLLEHAQVLLPQSTNRLLLLLLLLLLAVLLLVLLLMVLLTLDILELLD
jgi:hypothetical protein